MNALSRWKVVLYLTGIFLAGGVSGWVIARKSDKQTAFTAPQPKEIALSFRERVHTKLNLTADQVQKIDGIIERSSKELGAIHGENIQRIRTVVSNRNAQITAVLDTEQQKQFQQIEKEHSGREEWRGKSRGRGDGPREKRGTNNIASKRLNDGNTNTQR